MRKLETEFSKKSAGHYSPGVIHNETLYISGQLPVCLESGKCVEGGIRAQTKKALENVEFVLHEAKLSKENVVLCRVYTTDGGYWGDINEVYSEFFGAHKPARVVVPIGQLANGCLVEIEAVAEA